MIATVVQAWLITIQASAAALSALIAFYALRVTVENNRELRADRERVGRRSRVDRLAGALGDLQLTLSDDSHLQFEAARTNMAAAMTGLPHFPACSRVLEMKPPPYTMGDSGPRTLVEAALLEVRAYALSLVD